jgi:alkylated DNA nucleotide flippase Atl1
MTITLTIAAQSASELDEQLRSYIDHRRSPQTSSEPALSTDVEGDQIIAPTNDDYRRVIKAISRGKVAAYSVVSEAVRGDKDGSQKVAGLAANDDSLETAYRVVKRDGSIAAGFRWSDGRMGGADEGRRVLEEEGIRFDIHGRVLTEFMLSAAELRQLYEAAS